jgi:hypothetical protein
MWMALERVMSFASRTQPHSNGSTVVPVAHRIFAFFRAGIAMLLLLVSAVLGTAVAGASGPHWVAGVNYFDPAAKGTPVVWAGGKLSYYIDQGTLSSLVNQSCGRRYRRLRSRSARAAS